MSDAANETSTYGGQPVELYRFYNRTAQTWTFTSDGLAQNYNGETYQPAVLRRSAPEQSQERRQSRLKINCSRDFPIAALFRLFIPASTVWLTIYRKFRNSDQAIPYWTGRVRAVLQQGSGAEIEADPIDALLKRNGLRGRYQSGCNHVLYGPDCGVSSADYRAAGTVLNVSGTVITIGTAAIQPDGYYVNGLFERPSTGDYRMIVGHTSDQVTLGIPFQDLVPGEDVFIFKGCNHDVPACKSFNNLRRYGGFPMVPTRNPYSGAIA